MKVRTLCLTLAVALAAGAVACREEGTAEKAGRKIDEAVENVQNGVNDAAENVGDAANDALDSAKDGVEDLKEKAAAEE
ncbi:MAG TPA: hypothetical protein VFC77_13695 [Myxococcota bacterium]|nr:hypothetical protein [Myxococcota bacterium]